MKIFVSDWSGLSVKTNSHWVFQLPSADLEIYISIKLDMNRWSHKRNPKKEILPLRAPTELFLSWPVEWNCARLVIFPENSAAFPDSFSWSLRRSVSGGHWSDWNDGNIPHCNGTVQFRHCYSERVVCVHRGTSQTAHQSVENVLIFNNQFNNRYWIFNVLANPGIENQYQLKRLLLRLETKSCRILPLTYATKYDMT